MPDFLKQDAFNSVLIADRYQSARKSCLPSATRSMKSRHGLAVQLLCVLALCFWQISHAADVELAGFGTIGVACFSGDDADFVANDQPKGPGRSQKCDYGLDSVLGGQLDLKLNPNLEFGLQAIVDRNEDREIEPAITLAHLRWRPHQSVLLRVGRMASPVFLHSEDRQVRFALPWARTPLEVYGLIPTLYNDGIEVDFQFQFSDWLTEWQLGVSRFDFDTPDPYSSDTIPVDTDNAFINLLLKKRNTQIKLGYIAGRVSIHTDTTDFLFDQLRTLGGTNGRALANDLEIDNAFAKLIAFGMRHEQNNWLFISELAYRKIDSYFRDQYGFYFTVGRQIDDWMPYATVARRWTKGPNSDARAGMLFAPAVNQLLANTRYDSTSFSLGASKQLKENATLKLQIDRIMPDHDSYGLLFNHGPEYDFNHPDSEWLFSLSLDFIF